MLDGFKVYLVFEDGWKIVITFMEPLEIGDYDPGEWRGDIYQFPEY
jgi:hypothetical protein